MAARATTPPLRRRMVFYGARGPAVTQMGNRRPAGRLNKEQQS
jgi:hypothetical protein